MEHLYTGAALAQRLQDGRSVSSCWPVWAVARSLAEAEGIALAEVRIRCPSLDGWQNYTAILMQIDGPLPHSHATWHVSLSRETPL